MNIENIWTEWHEANKFNGVFLVSNEQKILFEKCCGYRNRSEKLINNKDTAFGIASGTKLFTGLAVCKLIDEGKLLLGDMLCDILHYDLRQIDRRVTIFHLLTHTSGVGDYLDEESSDCDEQFKALNKKYPVYLYEQLEYYLQMIVSIPPKFEPGARFGYSNAGFILLGLVIEAVSGLTYQDYVYENIIAPCKLNHTGFYRADLLPGNTALGYTNDGRTNIFSLPVLGGSDGGLYTCAEDLDKLWRAIFSNKVFSADMLREFTKQQSENYGLGVYRRETNGKLFYYAVGGDAGVDFFTLYYPEEKITASALGNTEINTYPLLEAIVSAIY